MIGHEKVKSHLPWSSLSPNLSHCHRIFDEKIFRVSGRITKPLQIQCQCTNCPQVLILSKDSFKKSNLSCIQNVHFFVFFTPQCIGMSFTSLLLFSSATDSSPPMNYLLRAFHISDFDSLKCIICSMDNHQ